MDFIYSFNRMNLRSFKFYFIIHYKHKGYYKVDLDCGYLKVNHAEREFDYLLTNITKDGQTNGEIIRKYRKMNT